MGSAAPNHTPADDLRHELDTTLQAEAADVFAGLILAQDGSLQVHLTSRMPQVDALIERAITRVRRAYPDPVTLPNVEQFPGVTNTLRALLRLQDEVTSRSAEFNAHGIRLSHWGIDLWINRLEIGVLHLTPEAKALLEREFDADKVAVVDDGDGWRTLGR